MDRDAQRKLFRLTLSCIQQILPLVESEWLQRIVLTFAHTIVRDMLNRVTESDNGENVSTSPADVQPVRETDGERE